MVKINLNKRGQNLKAAVAANLVAVSLLTAGGLCLGASSAHADSRSLKLYFVHTGEKAEVVFKRNGRYDSGGLKRINQILRDWRRNEPTRMDPRLLDLMWEAYRASGSRDYIHVVSAYRSPATNSMLRSRSKGVAEKSQHMLGRAIDFYLPDVKLKKLREIGLKMQGGGVGYYPSSGSPFVHFDVGNVRHWPKMKRSELVALFPNGKTLHVPSDGKPLPGFEQAVAAYDARRKSGSAAIALAGSSKPRSGGLLAALFGRNVDEEEESGSPVVVASAGRNKGREVQPPKKTIVTAQPRSGNGNIRIVPPELAPPVTISVATRQETVIAALPNSDVPLPVAAARPVAAVEQAAVADDDVIGRMAGDDVIGQLAMAAPFPSRRPDDTPPQAEAAAADQAADGGLMTVGEALANVSEPAMPVPTGRPDTVGIASASPDSALVLPETVAYAPVERDPVRVVASAASAAPGGIEAVIRDGNGRQQGRSIDTVLDDALAEDGQDVAVAATGKVRTTPKSARPGAQDMKSGPKPVVVAAQPQAARWALDSNYIANNSEGTKAPSYAYKVVYSAPREVYTAGFQKDDVQGQANKFSGKAVTFLSVARFN